MTARLVWADRVRTRDGVIGSAVLVEDGRIATIGALDDLRHPSIPELRFRGGTILPGFRDAHLHPVALAARRTGLDLSDVSDFAQLEEAVRAWAGRLRLTTPVVATGLDDTRLLEGRLPTRHDLDRILTARPMLIYRHCSHIAVANSAALELAGVATLQFDPPGGMIDRNERGWPTGVLREAAIGVVAGALEESLPAPTPATVADTLTGLARLGITSVGAMVSPGSPMWCGGGDELATLLAAAVDTPLRIDVFVMATTPLELREAAGQIEAAEGRIRFAGWKGFADGSLGGRTAHLREPYSDDPSSTGLSRWRPADMRAMAETALELGGGVAVHAIGDGAMDNLVTLAEQMGAPPGRFRAEHASVLDADLIDRMAQTGMVASVQPSFVAADAPFLERRLGERVRWVYPFRSLLEAGVRLLGGSDAPIEDVDPLLGMAAAHHRTGLGAHETLTPEQALSLYMSSRLRPGDPADLVVTDRDPAVDPSAAAVHATIIAGEVVS